MDGKSLVGKMEQVGRKAEALFRGYEKTCKCDMSLVDAGRTAISEVKGFFQGIFN